MRTITIYEFNELNADARNKAIENIKASMNWQETIRGYLCDIKDEKLKEESSGFLGNEFIIEITDMDALWEELKSEKYSIDVKYAISWELFTEVSITNLEDIIVTYREDLPPAFTDTAESFRKIIANWVRGCVIIANDETLRLKNYYESATGIKEYCVDHDIEFLGDGTIYG